MCRSPPIATPSRVISARLRAITSARVLSPVPSPADIPAAIANTFFSAPATSTPHTSVLAYTRNTVRVKIRCSAKVMCSSGIASTAAAA